MEKQLRILLVEDSIDDVALIKHLLKKEGISFICEVVETRLNYEFQLLNFKPDLVISDHSLPHFNSMEALEIFLDYKQQKQRSATFVLVTGTIPEEFAVEILKKGADDYILKDRLQRLPSAILNALEKNRVKEEKRKEEEKRLHLLDILQKSLHEIFTIDPETLLFQYANEEGLRNLGYTSEEFEKITPAETIHDFSEERFQRILKTVEHSSKGRIYERYAIRKDGSRYPIQMHLEMIEHGKKKLILASCVDITESKEQEQQKEIALFIQNSFNEELSLEESLKIILEELCRRSSIPAAEIWVQEYGENIRRYAQWKEPDRENPLSGKFFANKVYGTEEPYQCENLSDCQISPESPQEKYYKGAAAYPIKSGNNITAVIVIYTQEIIKEKNPFINLREGVQDKLAGNIKRKNTEEELQKIFELSPDILAILGKDGYVRKVNPALQNILGYTPEEMLQRSYDELIHPDDLYVLEDWRDKVLEEGEVANYQSRWLTSKGTYCHIAWSVTPFLKGELNFAVGKDITEHTKQVESIKKQNNRLAEIAWEQSHTVRAPLARLMACIAYLEEHEENREKMFDCIKASAYELDDIVKGIVSKTEKII